MKGGDIRRKKMKRKRHADVPMYEEEEGGKTSRKKMKMEANRKRYTEGRNTSKKKKKMEAKRKSPIEEEGRRTHGKKKMKRKRYCVDIPVDVLVDILSRLPARCVWRLRSVCKDWKSQIESPSFADLQLRRGSNEEKPVFMVWARRRSLCKTRFYSIDYKDGKAVRVGEEEFLHPNVAKASSINGLVCYHGTDGVIKVCNPVTRELFSLPKPTFLLPNLPKESPFDIGIGFDPTAKTYKVLAVCCGCTSEAEIFTLGESRGWRKIQYPSVKIWDILSRGLYASGCLFWFTSEYFGAPRKNRDMSRALMTFNFAQEKFEFVPLPPDFDFDILEEGHHWIHEVRGRVCLIEAKRHKRMVKMWTLAPNSWVDHHVVLPSYDDDIPDSVFFPIPSGVMLFKKADLKRYICFYNQQAQVVNSLKVHGIPRKFRPIQLHTESLVSLRSIFTPNL